MRVYLVRHGEAESNNDDHKRPLSPAGITEVKKVAQFLLDSNPKIKAVYHSTKLRAKQTAEILCHSLNSRPELCEREGLAPTDPVDPQVSLIEQHKGDIMLVGHMPFMGSLVSLLVSGESTKNLVFFQTGCLVILEKNHAGWVIEGVINPKFLN